MGKTELKWASLGADGSLGGTRATTPQALSEQPGFDCREKGKKGKIQGTGWFPLLQHQTVLLGEP